MGGIIVFVVLILAMLWALIQAVEAPGGGEEKRAAVLDRMCQLVAVIPMPSWARQAFGNRLVLGVLVDLLVDTGKRRNWFVSIPDMALAIGDPGGLQTRTGIDYSDVNKSPPASALTDGALADYFANPPNG